MEAEAQWFLPPTNRRIGKMKRLGLLVCVLLFGVVIGAVAEPVEVVLVEAGATAQVESISLTSTLAPGRLESRELSLSNSTKKELAIETKVEDWMDIHPASFKIKPGAKQKCLLFFWLANGEEIAAKAGWVAFLTKEGSHAKVKVVVFGPQNVPMPAPPDPKDSEIQALSQQVAAKDARIGELEGQLAEVEAAKGALGAKLADEIDFLKGDLEKKRKEYLACNDEKKRLGGLMDKLQREVALQKQEKSQLKAKVVLLEEKLAAWEKEFGAVQANINRLRSLHQVLCEGLKAEIERGEITISFRRSIELVILPDLFASGSTYPTRAKEDLITKIGVILKAGLRPDFKIEVRGHADSSPVTGRLAGKYSDNWELSAGRALKILYILNARRGVEIDGKYLSFSGCGSEQPVADNSTAEGRGKNRRVEIVVFIPE